MKQGLGCARGTWPFPHVEESVAAGRLGGGLLLPPHFFSSFASATLASSAPFPLEGGKQQEASQPVCPLGGKQEGRRAGWAPGKQRASHPPPGRSGQGQRGSGSGILARPRLPTSGPAGEDPPTKPCMICSPSDCPRDWREPSGTGCVAGSVRRVTAWESFCASTHQGEQIKLLC